jgi:heterodisulfide reductase subunit A-like polyferredoxin
VTVKKTVPASVTGKSGKTKNEISVGAVIVAPGLMALISPARYDFAAELRKHARHYGFSMPRKKTESRQTPFPHITSLPGIFVAGGHGSRAINTAIVAGSSVASLAAEALSSKRGSLAPEKQYPAEKRVAGDEPRIGIFACRNIFSDEKKAAAFLGSAHTLDSVVHVQTLPVICSPSAIAHVESALADHRLNRVVVCSCNARAHEPLYQEALAEEGLNRYLLHMTGLEAVWDSTALSSALLDAMRMAVARARMLEPLKTITSEVIPAGMVIGSGLSALSTALSLANQGFETYLVEQKADEHGSRRDSQRKKAGADILAMMRALRKQIAGHRKIQIFSDARIAGSSGHPGFYTTTLSVKGAQKVLKHAVVIIEQGQVQDDLAVLFKMPVAPDGKYLRPDELLPLDLACGGMFCCSYEDGTPNIRQSIVLGRAAASRAATILAKRELMLGGVVSIVDQEHCNACLACVRDCPYGAPSISEGGVAYIEPVECRGCGICVSECPRKAIELKHYTDEQILAELASFAVTGC